MIHKTLFFYLLACSIFVCSCGSDTATTDEVQDENKKPTIEAKKQKTAVADKSKLLSKAEVDALTDKGRAKRACECYRKLYDLRTDTQTAYQAGDKEAFANNEEPMRQARIDARSCTGQILQPIRSDQVKIDQFVAILSKTCPKYSSSILLMNKVTYKKTE